MLQRIINNIINSQNVGLEDLDKEYKELFLHKINTHYSEEQLYNFINGQNINSHLFNRLITNTINTYIINYLPKYIAAFINSNINGDLYFGIQDNGNIVGIPFFGELDKSVISWAINQCHVYLKAYNINNNKINDNIINKILKNIKIEISTIENFICNQQDYSQTLDDFINLDNNIRQEWKIYFEKYHLWHNDIMKYSCKLSDFLDCESIRNEIAIWIKSFSSNPKFKKFDLDGIAKMYQNNEYINRNISMDLLDTVRYDYSHPLKWLIDFKDYKHVTIKKQRPLQPLIKPLKNIYGKFCCNIKNISYLLQKQGYSFYILKFSIPSIKNIYIEYFSTKQNQWLYRSRKMNSLGPCLE